MASYEPPVSHELHASYSHNVLKAWNNSPSITASNLLFPIFVTDVDGKQEPINSLPNQYRWGVDCIVEYLTPLVAKGLTSVLLFGYVADKNKKDERGSFATDETSAVSRALRILRQTFPQLLLVADVCLCAYTTHGHCGILKHDGCIDNQPSIDRIAQLAVHYAKMGAHVIAPSDMMDGRIGAIKHALKQANLLSTVSVMSYAAKFASVFYGPFRDAAGSGVQFGDRSLYQLPPNSRDLALRAIERDLQEGADMIMVKPGGPYLDIVRDAKNMCKVPIAIYQVSGEYAMLYHAAAAGAFTLRSAVMETLNGMRRAGADIIITYYAPDVLTWLSEK